MGLNEKYSGYKKCKPPDRCRHVVAQKGAGTVPAVEEPQHPVVGYIVGPINEHCFVPCENLMPEDDDGAIVGHRVVVAVVGLVPAQPCSAAAADNTIKTKSFRVFTFKNLS